MRRIGPILMLIAVVACLNGRQTHALDASTVITVCGACHVASAASDSVIPSLKGIPRDEILTALKAYKAGTKPGIIMPRLTTAWSDAEIEQIADLIAKPGNSR